MQLQQILFSQGFGSRKDLSKYISENGIWLRNLVRQDAWQLCNNAQQEFIAEEIEWRCPKTQLVWQYHEKAYLVLNKLTGYECSQKPSRYSSIYDLLPEPLRKRPNSGKSNGVQAVGRLDQDTTGLLLFSDDGHFIHQMTSPKKHIAKTYIVQTVAPVTKEQCAKLLAGVVLRDSPFPVLAYSCTKLNEFSLSLAITQGKYHQVKRMIAATGNKVAQLHRSRIGSFDLPADLLPGQWRWLNAEQLKQLTS